MAIALWSLVLTMGAIFVALLREDLAESPDRELPTRASEDSTELS